MRLPDNPEVELDEHGFVTDATIWNDTLARTLAKHVGLGELSDDHFRVLRYVREHNLKDRAVPPMEDVCHHLHLEKHCVRRLFKGPLELWKVAGLTFPGTEAFTYMENEE